MPEWDDYVREVDEYLEPPGMDSLPLSGRVVLPGVVINGWESARNAAQLRVGAVAGAIAPRLGLLGFLPGIGGLLGPRAVPMSEVLPAVVRVPASWSSLVDLERVLPPQGDHAAVTFRLLALVESATRDLAYQRVEEVVGRVIAFAGDDSRFLEKVFTSNKGMTWSAMTAWFRGVSGALGNGDGAVTSWLHRRLDAPSPEVFDRLAACMRALTPVRNALAHSEGETFSSEQHGNVAVSLLGARLADWWSVSSLGLDHAPVTALFNLRTSFIVKKALSDAHR